MKKKASPLVEPNPVDERDGSLGERSGNVLGHDNFREEWKNPVDEEVLGAPGSDREDITGEVMVSRGPVRRLANMGVTLAVVASLLYITKDVVPRVWMDWLTGEAGQRESVSTASGSLAEVPANAVATPGMPAPDAFTTQDDETIAPENGAVQEEAAQGIALEEPPATGPDAPALSAPTFVVNFSAGSDLLESEAWHTLDSAALLLREQPDRIAVITDSDRGPATQALDPGLRGTRIAAVEQYLMAAGIDRQRLQIRGGALPGTVQGSGVPGDGPVGTADRFVYISIGSR